MTLARERSPGGAAPSRSQPVGARAVVLGAGVAGLLAARVLAEAYEEVVVVDRDALPVAPQVRRGAPQARHAHVLLAGGQRALEELLPGLTAELVARGAPAGDLLGDMRFWIDGARVPRGRIGLTAVTASRALLEAGIRDRVRRLANVVWTERHDVAGPVARSRHGVDGVSGVPRVDGVRLLDRGTGHETVLRADVLVDATGRGSRAPRWLRALGCAVAAPDEVPIRLAYATRRYRLRRGDLGGDLGMVLTPSPRYPRGAALTPVEDGVGLLTLSGVLGEEPPTSPDGFLAYARDLPVPDVYDAVRDVEPLDDPVPYRFPASRRHRFDAVRNLPRGLLIIGDAVASFNPVYGQGMSVAAMEALVLRRHLDGGRSPDPVAFQRDVARVVRPAWELAAGGDLAFPAVPGRRTARARLTNAYIGRLNARSPYDVSLAHAFSRVAGLVDPPAALLHPAVVARVLAPRATRPTAPAPRRARGEGR